MLITAIAVITITTWVKSEICCICIATFSVLVWSELCNWWMCSPSSRPCDQHTGSTSSTTAQEASTSLTGGLFYQLLWQQLSGCTAELCSLSNVLSCWFWLLSYFSAAMHSPVLKLPASTYCFNKHSRSSIQDSTQSCQTVHLMVSFQWFVWRVRKSTFASSAET